VVLAAVMLTPLGVTGAAAAQNAPAPAAAGHGKQIKDQYIVTFAADATAADVDAAREKAKGRGAKVHYNYSKAVKGFAATLSADAVADLESNPSVLAVEPDYEVHASDITQTPATWGLDRIDQAALPLNNAYTYGNTGAGVTAYVIDTGIRTTHTQFGGRASGGYTAINDGNGTNDCAGHGTHVAGTIGGSTYGVAKGVKLVAVRVLDCSGSGSNSGVIAGIDWVTKNHSGPSVANMSLGGGASSALDTAVNNSIASGVAYAVAAGNDNANACSYSPARVSAAITVGATTSSDARSSFSNYGSCVDLFAPGSSITSSINTSDTATAVYNGTSMATPHVAGVIATYLQGVPGALPADVRTALMGAATTGKVTGAGTGSPNVLLHSILGSVVTPPPPPPPPPPTGTGPVASAPTATMQSTGQIGTSTVPVKVSWSATDPDGIGSYELQQSTNGGSTWANVTLPAPTSTSVTLNLAPSSALRFRVRAFDVPGNTGEYAQGSTFALTLRQEDGSGVSYPSGPWYKSSLSGASGGYVGYSTAIGARAQVTFTGTGVSWIGSKGSNWGRAEVFVDGVSRGVVDQYSSSTQTRQILFSSALSAGSHTLEVRALHTKNAASTGYVVDDDAFVTVG
jgi:subtilisin family serine protease